MTTTLTRSFTPLEFFGHPHTKGWEEKSQNPNGNIIEGAKAGDKCCNNHVSSLPKSFGSSSLIE